MGGEGVRYQEQWEIVEVIELLEVLELVEVVEMSVVAPHPRNALEPPLVLHRESYSQPRACIRIPYFPLRWCARWIKVCAQT